jgi:hypothetical protein
MSTRETRDPPAVTGSNTRTRSGRIVKKPERYEPVEQVEDDYAPEDYDSAESSVSSVMSDNDSDEYDDESDADDDGNLDGFVVPDKSESGDSDTDGEPPVSRKKQPGAPVKKRPVTRTRRA